MEHKGFMYMENQKVMYGLPQAGKISNDKLKLHLDKFGYETEPIMLGLWWYQTRLLQFSLVVNEFWVKYEPQAYITHLLNALKTIYKISEDWDYMLYCGPNL